MHSSGDEAAPMFSSRGGPNAFKLFSTHVHGDPLVPLPPAGTAGTAGTAQLSTTGGAAASSPAVKVQWSGHDAGSPAT